MPALRHPVVVVALAAVSLLVWFGSQTTSRPGPGLEQAALTQTEVEALPAAAALAGARLDPAEVAAASTERKVATAPGRGWLTGRTLVVVTQKGVPAEALLLRTVPDTSELDFARAGGLVEGRWRGRPLPWSSGLQQAIEDESGHASNPASDLVFELDPAAPRAVALACAVAFDIEVGTTRIRYRATERVTLPPDRALIHLALEFKVATPWASGVVAPPVPVDLSGARVELCVLPEASRRDIVLELTTPFVVHASAPVTAHHTFVLPPPEDASPARGRLRLVLGDGSLHLERRICWKFDRHITLSLPSETPERGGMRGRILYQGRSAAGLATLWCERRGARIGACEIDAEGRFTLRGLPQEREGVELVIGGSGPTLELFRRPLPADLADIGDVELEPLTRALVLELFDVRGEATQATLQWRTRQGSGRRHLRPAASHTVLLSPSAETELTLLEGAWSEALVVRPGVQRVFVPETP